MTDLSLNDVASALLSQRWVFAKTMPENPHWYTLRKEWQGEPSFEAVVRYIRDHGYRGKYGKTSYTYLNLKGLRYWTMGADIPATILINRSEGEARATARAHEL